MKTYTRSTNYRLGRGRLGLEAVRSLDLDLPEPVAEAEAKLAALHQRRGQIPSSDAVRGTTVAALLEDPTVDLAALAAAEIARDVEDSATMEAVDRMAESLSHLVAAHADDFVVAARAKVFEPAVATLTAAAALEPSATLSDLVKAKRNDDAHLLTEAPLAAARVRECFTLRDRLYRNETNGMPHSRWENPEALDRDALSNLQGLDWFVAGIRQCGRLWLGTYAELDAKGRGWEEAEKARRTAEQTEANRRRADAVAAGRTRAKAIKAKVRA
jgi:hypothetical protein